MGVISVKNLGQVRIKGDTPTQEEKKNILSIIQKKQQDAKNLDLTTNTPQIYSEEVTPRSNERSDSVEAYLTSPEFGRLAAEIGFAVGGAMTGGTLSAARMVLKPALQTLYRSAGAGIGQATGAGIASTTFDPKEEVSKDVFRAFAQGATFEAVGAAIPAIIKKVRFKGMKTTKEADEAERIIQEQKLKYKEKVKADPSKYDEELSGAIEKGFITPGLATENRVVDILENVAQKSLFGGGGLQVAREGAETLTSKFVDDFVANYGSITRNDYGSLLQNAIVKNVDEWKVSTRSLYDQVTKLSKGVKVDISDVQKQAKIFLKEAQFTKRLKPEGIKVLETIIKQPSKISFTGANSIRSDFLGITRSSNELIKGQSQRYAATLANKLTKAIDDVGDTAVRPLSGELKLAYNQAQQVYKQGSEVFNDKIIRNLIKKNPDEVFKNVIKTERPGIIDAVNRVVNKTKNPAEKLLLRNNLQGSFLFDLQSESVKRYNSLNGDFLLKNFNKYGNSVLTKVFNPNEIKQVRSLFEALKVAQKKSAGENLPGGMFIQLSQAGALFGLGAGVAVGPAAAILLGPAVISKLFTNPKFVSLLKRGFKLQPGNPEYYRWGTRLMNTMVTEGLVSQEQGEEFLEEFKNIK